MIQRLSDGSYDQLEIKRIENGCYLIMHLDGKPGTVFVKKNGTYKEYGYIRHITHWLEERFGIQKETILFS